MINIYHIFILCLLQIFIINPLEKIFVQMYFKTINRPNIKSNNNNFNLPKTKSTKLKDIKTFASRYRSPSPIITKKTKQLHTNQNFVKLKSDSDLYNTVGGSVPFTPVKHENKSHLNNSKPKSNNVKTPNNNKNHQSPITSLPWLP